MIRDITPKEIEIWYSCQNNSCGQIFRLKNAARIDVGFYPVCSSKCGFKVIYNFLKKNEFEDKILLEMQLIAEKKEEIKEFSRQNALYSIAKYYSKIGLSKIKFILGTGQGFVQMDKSLTSGQMDKLNPPYIIGGCPLSCPNPIKNTESSLVPSFAKKGELSKWF